MTSVVRYSLVTNPTGAVLTTAPANAGDELASQYVKRVFAAIDIGAQAGKTQDTASNPTLGCLVAQFSGSRIIDVSHWALFRPLAATNATIFKRLVIGTGANTANIGWNVNYNPQTGISSLYLLDAAAGAPGLIIANDYVIACVLLGSSPSLAPQG